MSTEIEIKSYITDNKKRVTYNFYSTYIVASSVVKQNTYFVKNSTTDETITSPAQGYLSIKNYAYNANTPHVMSNISGIDKSFIINEIRIYQQIHNLGTTYSGEMVIETINPDTEDYIYICIPLQDKGLDTSNDLDGIIQNVVSNPDNCPKKLSLNKIIQKPTSCYIHYVADNITKTCFGGDYSSISSKKAYMVVLNNPITITQKTHKIINETYTDINWDYIQPKTTMKFVRTLSITGPEALPDDNIYIDCKGDTPEVKSVFKHKFTDKDLKEIFMFLLFCFFFIVIFIILDEFSNYQEGIRSLGAILNQFLLGEKQYGRYFAGFLLIVDFLFFLTAILKKNVDMMKKGIYLLSFCITFLFILKLNFIENG